MKNHRIFILLITALLLSSCSVPSASSSFTSSSSSVASVSTSESKENPEIAALGDFRIVDIASTFGCTAVLTDKGNVITGGWNEGGTLGNGTRDLSDSLHLVKLEEPIRLLIAGDDLFIAVGEKGGIYTWGYSLQNTWMTEPQSEYVHEYNPSPVKLATFSGVQIKDIDVGAGTVVVLTENDSVYTFGRNRRTFGYKTDLKYLLTPIKVNLPNSNIISVKANRDNVFALAGDGTVYYWGRDLSDTRYEVVADSDVIRDDRAYIDTPVKLALPEKAVQIAVSSQSFYSLSETGFVYSIGVNWHGELGIGSKDDYSGTVQKVSLNFKARSIHSSVWGEIRILSELGELYQAGILTQDPGVRSNTEVFTGITRVSEILTKGVLFFYKDTDGQIWGRGSNYHRELLIPNLVNGYISDPVKITHDILLK